MSRKTRTDRVEQLLTSRNEAQIIGIQDDEDGETVVVTHWRGDERIVETFNTEQEFREKYPDSLLIAIVRGDENKS